MLQLELIFVCFSLWNKSLSQTFINTVLWKCIVLWMAFVSFFSTIQNWFQMRCLLYLLQQSVAFLKYLRLHMPPCACIISSRRSSTVFHQHQQLADITTTDWLTDSHLFLSFFFSSAFGIYFRCRKTRWR